MPPRIFRLSTPVWQADLDAFGELRSSALLRFLQETATRASTDAGFDPQYYERAGTTWIVRRTTLTVLTPVGYQEQIEATTWIADFRRVRSRRDYEVRSGDRLVARAHSDWVYADRVKNRPQTIPTDMQRAFAPDGARTLSRTPFTIPTHPRTADHFERRVELHELDSLRHVNNANYANYLEQVAADAAAAAGWPLESQVAVGGRFRAIAHDLEYLDAALLNETLSLVTWPLAVDTDRLDRYTLVLRPGSPRPLLRATSAYAWVDTRTGTQQAIPTMLRAALVPTDTS